MLLKELQRIRNLTRLTIKQDKDYMDKFIPAAMEYSNFRLKEMMSFHAELDKNTAEIDKALKEAETLPKHLYEEVFEHPGHTSSSDLMHWMSWIDTLTSIFDTCPKTWQRISK